MIRYAHLRYGKIAVTLAYIRRTDNSLEYGVSFCSKKDNFCKKTGRDIALYRLTCSTDCIYISKTAHPTISILLDICYNHLYPESFEKDIMVMLANEIHYTSV